MTAEEFTASYAERMGKTPAWLKQHGFKAQPCACGDERCKGWVMGDDDDEERVETFTQRVARERQATNAARRT